MAENNFAQNATTDIVIDALMGVTDPAAIATDILLDQLIDALINHYTIAAADIEKKSNNYFSKFKDADAKKRADVEAGKLSKDDYTKWRAQKMLTGDHYKDLKNVLVSDMTHANQIAADIINNKKPDAYALNHNYGVYEIEHSTGLATSYVMYDHDTVENLIAENPQILPKNKIDIPADKKWNMQKINNALTQGVLQGESIPDISKRLQTVTDMNKNAAIRNARTAVTGAQNAGRDDSYRRAESMGIPVSQIWVSTLDGRTRHSHRAMMGEVRKGKTFSNGLRYPGDPWGAGEEVYNCRCTMIANVNDVDYGIEDMVNSKLKEKGMTWDEWVNEQPLSKHNGESKTHYLQRYSEHKKKLSFKEWLGEQADPDSGIMSVWGDKKYGYVYNLIKNSAASGHGADANNFFNALKDLGQKSGIGNPPQVWNAYMTGQLDAEDFNKFETILKKYLPDTGVSGVSSASDAITSAVNAATSASTSLDNISDAAKKAIADLNLTAGNPMTKIEADTYKVNPMYNNITGDPSHKNCQTATFAYECRRQGYDVVALTKDSSIKEIFDLQDKLGKDQSEGWINKVTGKKPDAVISHGVGTTQSLSEMLNELENAIGKNGERYTLGVKFKSGGAHAINLDRDENGLLRIIDNQKGAPLKNTWVGKEVEDYFSMKGVEHIRKVYRVDDCVPNPEFFNKIVKQSPTSIVKTSLAKGDDVAKILDDIKDNLSGAPIKNILLGDNWSEYVSIMSKNHSGEGAIDELWQKYLKGDLKDPDLDKLISKMYGLDIVDVSKVDDALKAHISAKTPQASKTPPIANGAQYGLDMDVISSKSASAVWKELNQAKAGGGKFWSDITAIANKYGEKPGELWKKYYLTGKLDPDDAAKIEAHLAKIYSKSDDVSDIAKKWQHVDDVFDASIPSTVLDDMAAKGIIDPQDHWKKYLAGEIKDTDIDHALKGVTPPVKTDKVDKIEDINNDIVSIAKKEIDKLEKSESTYSFIFSELEKIDASLADELDTEMVHLMGEEHFINKHKTLNAYLNGDLKSDKLDEIFTKFYGDKIPSTNPYKGKDLLEIMADPKLQPGQPALEHILNDIGGNYIDYVKSWANGEIVDIKLDELLLGKKVATVPEVNKLDFLKSAYNLTGDKYDIDDVIAKLLDNETAKEIAKENKGSLTTVSYLKGYIHGKITDLELDAALGISKTVSNAVTAVDMDLLKTKTVSKVWNELKAQEGTAYSQFWKTVGEAGKDYGLEKKQSKVWEMYLNGKLKPDESKKIDDFLLKHYFNKTDNIIDYSKFGGKEIYDILKNYDSIDDFLFNVPGAEYDKIVKLFHNNADEVQAAIDEIKKLEKANAATKAAKAAKTAEKSEELVKAQEKLKKAQEELEEIKKELAQIPNKTYTGIWKNDVTLADYESKQATLAAKKQYYYDQIEELEHCIDDPDSWQFKKYGGEEGLNKKIAECEKYIDDLSEFEIKGKEYLDEKTKIDKKIKQAEKVVTDAQDEVRQLTPVGEAFTQERKDAAVWAKNKTSEYEKVDKYYETVASKVHGSKTSIEHEGYYHYTWGSGPFNEPLYMFRNIDANGYGSKIRGLTSLIEKSSYDKDVWIQSAQNHITIEAFLGIKPGTLSNMTVEEAQQFVGVQNEIPQFLSGAVNKYGGSYNPGNMTVNIYCPAGSEILYVRNDGHFGKNEHEMILQRGGTYKLTKIYKGKGTHNTTEWIVDLELHPEVGYNKVQQ